MIDTRSSGDPLGGDEVGLCPPEVCTHNSKPFEREMFPRFRPPTRSSWRGILPQMEVSLLRQDKSQPASHDHPEHSCLSRGHCSHIYVHEICQHFTGGVPRLPRWQPAHTTGGWCSRWSMPEAASLSRPASASVLTAELARSLTGKLPASERGSRGRSRHHFIRTL